MSTEESAKIARFLEDLFPAKEDRDKFVRIVSNALSGKPSENVNIFNGAGSNGKSALVRLLWNYFEDDIVILSSGFFEKHEDDDEDDDEDEDELQYIKELKDKMFVITSDLEDGSEYDHSFIKAYVGRDPLHDVGDNGELVSHVPKGELIFVTNSIPFTDSPAMRDRCNIVNFDTVFSENPTKPDEKTMNREIVAELASCKEAFIAYVSNYVANLD